MLPRRRLTFLLALCALLAGPLDPILQGQRARELEAIRYTFRVVNPAKHIAEVEARIPTGGQASIDLRMPVWTPGYYVKGNVVSFLLDAHVRRVTDGKRSLDDVMRLAMKRYGGDRGFTADELRKTVDEIAGRNVKPWFTKAIASAGELEYGEMLGWYGLRFSVDDGGPRAWQLEERPRATPAQRRQLAALVRSSAQVHGPRPNR